MKRQTSFEWHTIAGRTGYMVLGGILVPAYQLSDRELVLFDSALTPEPALIEFLKEKGFTVRAVLQTHLHIDHIGNNKLLQEAFGTEIYATQAEILDTIPRFVRRLAAKRGDAAGFSLPVFPFDFTVTPLRENARSIRIANTEFRIEDLRGHSPGHVGYGTPDGVLCLGDALLSSMMVHLSKLPYFQYPETATASMERLLPAAYEYYALAHAEVVPAADLPDLVRRNIDRQEQLSDNILDLVEEPTELEDLIDTIIYGLDIHMRTEATRRAAYHSAYRYIKSMVKMGRLRVIHLNGINLYTRT